MELELNIDPNGRTTYDKTTVSTAKKDAEPDVQLDYSCKTVATALAVDSESSDQNLLDELLYDCEIADCGLLPRTFWIDAVGTKPRCRLEQMALDVFHHHVPEGYVYDESTSGAEWWVQLRPSPSGRRYSMHDSDPDEMSKTGISFHWDKDEELRLLMGGSMYVHPHISTVTYLTDIGAPTIAMNCRVDTFTGEWVTPNESREGGEGTFGFLSWPKQGKHLSFDGRYLHAAPPDLMEADLFKRQCMIPEEKQCTLDSKSSERSMGSAELRLLRRRHRRVTFLVNIWLNYKPIDVDLFPESMLEKLSKVSKNGLQHLFRTEQVNQQEVRRIVVLAAPESWSNREPATRDFVWPLGGCGSNETLHARMPIVDIRKEAVGGGNIHIHWKTSKDDDSNTTRGIQLVKGGQPQTTQTDKESKSTESFDNNVKPPKRARGEGDG